LKPLYNDKDAVAHPDFGHPADELASALLEIAETDISVTNWIQRRPTNEQLRAEQADVLRTLQKGQNLSDKHVS
jgi:hypothetical protein